MADHQHNYLKYMKIHQPHRRDQLSLLKQGQYTNLVAAHRLLRKGNGRCNMVSFFFPAKIFIFDPFIAMAGYFPASILHGKHLIRITGKRGCYTINGQGDIIFGK